MAIVKGTGNGETINAADGVTEGMDVIYGYGGIDKIYGLGGDDTLKGGGGADELHGGAGNDTASYSDSYTGVEVSLLVGAGSGGTAQGDTLFSIENLTGSDYNDTLQGAGNDNILSGGKGNDILKGAGGSDTLWGGEGNDYINSDGVGDKIDGGSGIDGVNFSTADTGISVSLATGLYGEGLYVPLPKHPGAPKWIENVENVYGSNHNDRIWGDDNPNVLWGRDGVDQIWAGDGNDTVVGGAGADQMHGQDGADTLSYAESSAGVTVLMADGFAVGGHGEGDTFDGFENVRGSDHADIILGDGNINLIEGAGGDDVLFGLGGHDNFMFQRSAAGPIDVGHDEIGDFTVGQDNILIDNSIFANFAQVQSHMEQVGTTVVITLSPNDSITLHGVNVASLSASDFLFV